MTDDRPSTEESTIQEAFSLVGNEVRADVLRALGRSHAEDPRGTISFSTLRERVDGSMDSSQFNYHLQQLVPTFVRRGEDGYRLHPRGLKLYRAIAAGTYTREEVLAPVEADFECHFCESPVVGRYEDDRFTVRCTYCDHVYARRMVPPSAVEDWRDVLRRVDRAVRADLLTAADGVCPSCLNEMDVAFLPAEEAPVEEDLHLDVVVVRTCDHCGARRVMSVGETQIGNADLIAFANERGLDVPSTPVWQLEFAATDRHTEVLSRDPWRVELSVPIEGDTLTLTITADLSVESSTVD
ncbi:MAG: winged helix-turn-helix domain-containing protein [Halanaeroarchaeum sp.]